MVDKDVNLKIHIETTGEENVDKIREELKLLSDESKRSKDRINEATRVVVHNKVPMSYKEAYKSEGPVSELGKSVAAAAANRTRMGMEDISDSLSMGRAAKVSLLNAAKGITLHVIDQAIENAQLELSKIPHTTRARETALGISTPYVGAPIAKVIGGGDYPADTLGGRTGAKEPTRVVTDLQTGESLVGEAARLLIPKPMSTNKKLKLFQRQMEAMVPLETPVMYHGGRASPDAAYSEGLKAPGIGDFNSQLKQVMDLMGADMEGIKATNKDFSDRITEWSSWGYDEGVWATTDPKIAADYAKRGSEWLRVALDAAGLDSGSDEAKAAINKILGPEGYIYALKADKNALAAAISGMEGMDPPESDLDKAARGHFMTSEKAIDPNRILGYMRAGTIAKKSSSAEKNNVIEEAIKAAIPQAPEKPIAWEYPADEKAKAKIFPDEDLVKFQQEMEAKGKNIVFHGTNAPPSKVNKEGIKSYGPEGVISTVKSALMSLGKDYEQLYKENTNFKTAMDYWTDELAKQEPMQRDQVYAAKNIYTAKDYGIMGSMAAGHALEQAGIPQEEGREALSKAVGGKTPYIYAFEAGPNAVGNEDDIYTGEKIIPPERILGSLKGKAARKPKAKTVTAAVAANVPQGESAEKPKAEDVVDLSKFPGATRAEEWEYNTGRKARLYFDEDGKNVGEEDLGGPPPKKPGTKQTGKVPGDKKDKEDEGDYDLPDGIELTPMGFKILKNPNEKTGESKDKSLTKDELLDRLKIAIEMSETADAINTDVLDIMVSNAEKRIALAEEAMTKVTDDEAGVAESKRLMAAIESDRGQLTKAELVKQAIQREKEIRAGPVTKVAPQPRVRSGEEIQRELISQYLQMPGQYGSIGSVTRERGYGRMEDVPGEKGITGFTRKVDENGVELFEGESEPAYDKPRERRRVPGRPGEITSLRGPITVGPNGEARQVGIGHLENAVAQIVKERRQLQEGTTGKPYTSEQIEEQFASIFPEAVQRASAEPPPEIAGLLTDMTAEEEGKKSEAEKPAPVIPERKKGIRERLMDKIRSLVEPPQEHRIRRKGWPRYVRDVVGEREKYDWSGPKGTKRVFTEKVMSPERVETDEEYTERTGDKEGLPGPMPKDGGPGGPSKGGGMSGGDGGVKIEGMNRLLGMGFMFVAYRMARLANQMASFATNTIGKMISSMQNWEKAMDDVGLAIGLMGAGYGGEAAAGMNTPEKKAGAIETLKESVTVGLGVQAAMGEIDLAMMKISNAAGPALIGLLNALADTMQGPVGEFLVGFITGFSNIITALLGAFNFLGPVIAPFMGFLGHLAAALAVLAIPLGFILTVLSAIWPIVMMLGQAAAFLGVVFNPLTWIILGAVAAILVLISYKDAFIHFFTDPIGAIKDAWNALVGWINSVIAWTGIKIPTVDSSNGSTSSGAKITQNQTVYQNNYNTITGDVDLDKLGDYSARKSSNDMYNNSYGQEDVR